MSNMPKPYLLSFGLESHTRDILRQALGDIEMVEKAYSLDELIAEPPEVPPLVIICGPPPADIPLTDVAQSLRMQYPKHRIFFTTLERNGFDHKNFKKNGFSDAFLLPMEAPTFTAELKNELASATKGAFKSYRQVKLLDLSPDTPVNFDAFVHLPSNNKYIRVSNAGDSISKERMEKFKVHDLRSIHVTRDQMPKFYEYVADKLRSSGKDGKSETEVREASERMIRDLFSSLYNDNSEVTFDDGKNFVEDCNEIVKAYITTGSSEHHWYEKLLSSGGLDSSTYSHASNTAAYAALFSMALGIGKPEDLAFVGLLHDIGLANVPTSVQDKNDSERTQEERELYQKHPEFSVNMIKSRKIPLSENLATLILQHHERFDGKGFPRGLMGTRIKKEAQILGIADRFDELCSGSINQKPMKPHLAIKLIADECMHGASKAPYDPAIVEKLVKLFAPPEEENKTEKSA